MNKIDLKVMSNKQSIEFVSYLETKGFTNYFDTKEKRIKLIYAFKYTKPTYYQLQDAISKLASRPTKQCKVNEFLSKMNIAIPKDSTGISEKDWIFIQEHWFTKLKNMEDIFMEKLILNKEQIKDKLEEVNVETQETINKVSIPREEIEREIKIEQVEEQTRKQNKRGSWKRDLVKDLITNQIMTCEEYLNFKNIPVRKGNTWHIDNETEVVFRKQTLKAIWYKEELEAAINSIEEIEEIKEEDNSLQNEQ